MIKYIAIGLLYLTVNNIAWADKAFITLGSTTTLQASGFFDKIPLFAQQYHIDVRVIAAATGKIANMARAGDIDILITHHRESEQNLIDENHALSRVTLMMNNFILLSPKNNLTKIAHINSPKILWQQLYQLLHDQRIKFISRADDSGTYHKELSLWQQAGINQNMLKKLNPKYYLQTGSGMGASLLMAQELNAYILTDRASWINFQHKYDNLNIIDQSNDIYHNPYSIVILNPKRHSHIKAQNACMFAQWLIRDDIQHYIANMPNKLFTPLYPKMIESC